MREQSVGLLDDYTFGPNSYNPCMYVNNNPVNATDPSGLIPNPIIKPKRTSDQERMNNLCKRAQCNNCSADVYQKYIQRFQDAIKATWITNICGIYVETNTCQRWAFDLERRLPNFGIGSDCVKSAGIAVFNLGGWLSPRHVAYKLEMCDGAVIYADNGAWGGSDHIFYPENIPGSAKPA